MKIGWLCKYTSHAKLKKTEVEEHHRISSIYNKTKSVTACNDSLNSRTSNANAVVLLVENVCFNSIHDACVSKYLNDVNARTKKPKVVPISTRKPKRQANKSVATPLKKTVASESTNHKLYNSYYSFVDSGCSKHMTGKVSLDLIQGNNHDQGFTTSKVLNHNLFSVGQFECADLEVAFRKSTLAQLHSIQFCLMAKASPTQAWVMASKAFFNLHISNYIKLLSKKVIVDWSSSQRRVPSSKGRLNLLNMDFVVLFATEEASEFLNKTLNAFFYEEGIGHQTSTLETPEQNGRCRKTKTATSRCGCSYMDVKTNFLMGPLKRLVYVAQPEDSLISDHPESLPSKEKLLWIENNSREPDPPIPTSLDVKEAWTVTAMNQAVSNQRLNMWSYLHVVLSSNVDVGHSFKIMASTTTKYVVLRFSVSHSNFMQPSGSTPVPSTSILDRNTNWPDMFTLKAFLRKVSVSASDKLCLLQTALGRSYALEMETCQGDSLNLPDHRIHKDGDGDASF
ncbi:hypothetical protein Tco_0179162 [Tanacetum coccineum]